VHGYAPFPAPTPPTSSPSAPLPIAPSSPAQLRSPSPAIPGGDALAPELPRAELAAIFRVMADLLDDPAWPQLHPWPYTDTSWPGLQCDLALDEARVLRATRLHLGIDVATPPCRLGARLDPPRCAACRASGRSPSSAASTLPALFMSSSSLEQIVLKSDPGLTGPIPAMLVLILVNIVLYTPMVTN
jgi:hypothetical protein